MLTNPARRVLLLAPFPPRLDAVHGGARVAAHSALHLASRHRVALLYLRGKDDPALDPRLAQECDLVREVPRAEFHSRLYLLRSILSGMPKWAAEWYTPEFARAVREVARTWEPDIVQAEFHVMGQYFRELDRALAGRVLVEHEIGSATAAQRVAASGPATRLPLLLNLRAWRHFERRVAQEADAVVVFTARDLRALAALGVSTPARCIPFGPTFHPSAPTGGGATEILFVGNFSHPPNVDAALRLMRHIYPAVRRQRPQATLTIVGAAPTPEMLRAVSPGIGITGEVPDIEPFLVSAAVVVAPLRLGGGMRVKVLEALAAARPLVASPLALEGIPVVPEKHVLVAATDGEFRDQILRLLGDPTLRQSLSREGSEWLRSHAVWDKFIDSYEDLYAGLRAAPALVRG